MYGLINLILKEKKKCKGATKLYIAPETFVALEKELTRYNLKRKKITIEVALNGNAEIYGLKIIIKNWRWGYIVE